MILLRRRLTSEKGFRTEDTEERMEPAILISSICAVMAAVGVWQKERDYRLTREEFDRVLTPSQTADGTIQVARIIAQLLPQDTLDLLGQNVRLCWESFNDKIRSTGGSIPSHGYAEDELVKCIRAQLRSIKALMERSHRGNFGIGGIFVLVVHTWYRVHGSQVAQSNTNNK